MDDLYDAAVGPPDPHAGPRRVTEWSCDPLDFVPDDWPCWGSAPAPEPVALVRRRHTSIWPAADAPVEGEVFGLPNGRRAVAVNVCYEERGVVLAAVVEWEPYTA